MFTDQTYFHYLVLDMLFEIEGHSFKTYQFSLKPESASLSIFLQKYQLNVQVESLAKKYDEKFKQAGESQSRLLADELAFRDIQVRMRYGAMAIVLCLAYHIQHGYLLVGINQERRLELYNAIIRMEQGGNENALLQVTNLVVQIFTLM